MNSKFFIKKPDEFQNICLIYPPSVNDIIDDPYSLQYIKLLTLSQEEIVDPLILEDKPLDNILTPFETILNLAYNQPQFNILIKQAFNFFTHEEVMFLYEQKAIIIGSIVDIKSIKQIRLINETNYFDFQNKIREACGNSPIEPFDYFAPMVKLKMDAKRRNRDKIKAKQSGLTLDSLLVSFCCMGLGITPLNIGELSYAAISPIMATYQAKEKYEIDIDSLLAGASADKVKPEYWIKNLDKKQE